LRWNVHLRNLCLNIVTEIPLWFFPLCLLTGAVYAFGLYFLGRKRSFTPLTNWILAGLRFAVVSLISFLLLSPLVRHTRKIIQKPVVAIGLDASRSIPVNKDSVYFHSTFQDQIRQLNTSLGDSYDVRFFSFGEKVREGIPETFPDRKTDMGSFFSEISDRFAGQNLGAVILAGDGIWNQGLDPVRAATEISCPVYTIALGDTAIKKDIIIREVLFNKVAYLGDRFPIEIETNMNLIPGASTGLSLSSEGKTLDKTTLKASGSRSVSHTVFWVEATKAGTHRYTVTAAPVEGEVTPANNSRDVYIEVLESRQTILLAWKAPHPDIAALTSTLESTGRFKIESTGDLSKIQNTDAYSLVIFHEIPEKGYDKVREITDKKIPLLFMMGSGTDLRKMNDLNFGFRISSDRGTLAEVTPVLNEKFSLFGISDNYKSVIQGYPPLTSPFGTYQQGKLTDVLLYQGINNVTSTIPLVFFMLQPEKRIGVIAGENIWKWKLWETFTNGQPEVFNDLINNIVQYLTIIEDKSYFRVRTRPAVDEIQEVLFQAEVYNKSYEAVTEPEVNLVIKDEEGRSYPFVFGRDENSYTLNAGLFPPGVYSYTASTKTGSDSYKKTGSFRVTTLDREGINLTADHRILRTIAFEHEGTMVYPADIPGLADTIRNREDISSTSVFQKSYSNITGSVWLFILILALITLEWVIRKREGTL